MVSKNPNTGSEGFNLDPTDTMSLPELNPYTPTSVVPEPGATALDDSAKRVRKPYTITKSRESWTEPEHDKFLEALQLFDRDWKKIEAFVGTKTIKQIRSHAQKYFIKAEKNGTTEHLPPPRPKRKAAHPYPQKASKTGGEFFMFKMLTCAIIVLPNCHMYILCWAVSTSLQTVSFQSSATSLQPAYLWSPNSSSMLQTSVTNGAMSFWPNNTNLNSSHLTKGPSMVNNCTSSSKSTSKAEASREKTDQEHPDFSRVYKFIGSVFDPDVTDHLQRLKLMAPIEVKSVLQLMTNLSINLFSPEFEFDRKVLSTYKIDSDITHYGDEMRIFESDQCCNAI